MKKAAAVLLAVMIIVLTALPGFAANTVYDDMKIVKLYVGDVNATVNYQPMVMDQAAYVSNGRTLVPFRFLGEALGAQVYWDPNTKTAQLKLGDNQVAVAVGSSIGLVNTETVAMDVPAEIKDGRLFVPLRFIAENLGVNVNFDSETKQILLRRVDTKNWVTFDSKNGLSYRHNAQWTAADSADEENVVVVKSPKGSEMLTYYSEKKADAILVDMEAAYAADGWEFNALYWDDEADHDNGFELNYHKTVNGVPMQSIVFVDGYEDGSIVGEALCTETNAELDAYILYLIMAK